MSSVVERRAAERAALLDEARAYAAGLPRELQPRAVVVFGSVARGDFNLWSDIDVLVIADALPDRLPDRMAAVSTTAHGKVAAIPWTTTEWFRMEAKGNPIALEARAVGITVAGALPEQVQPTDDRST